MIPGSVILLFCLLFHRVTFGDACGKKEASGFPCDIIRNNSVRKCFCTLDEVFDGSTCIKQQTKIPVVNVDPWTQKEVPSTIFQSAPHKIFRCDPKDLLTPLRNDSFHILPNGNLIQIFTGVIYSKDNYCIEHVLDDLHGVRLGGMVCVSRPELPLCCENGQYLDPVKYECINSTGLVINPPMYFEPTVLYWKSMEGYNLGFPACYEDEIYRQFDIDKMDKVVLLYRSNGVFLHWKSAPQKGAFVINPHEYCIAPELRNGRLYHSVYFCDKRPSTPIVVREAAEEDEAKGRPFILPIVFVLMPRL